MDFKQTSLQIFPNLLGIFITSRFKVAVLNLQGSCPKVGLLQPEHERATVHLNSEVCHPRCVLKD